MPVRLLAPRKREEESPKETGTAGVEEERGQLGVWGGARRGKLWLKNFITAAKYCTSARPDGVLIHASCH